MSDNAPPLPPYFPAPISRPEGMPKHHLNGTQDMFALFDLVPIYDRAVRPYNQQPDAPKEQPEGAPKKPTKPPPTYAHYVEGLAGRVKPPRKAARAQRGITLHSILHKPEYTPQRIVPFDRETIQSAFKVQSGEVPEIDQSLLEPDEEEVPRKKKKKNKDRNPAPAR